MAAAARTHRTVVSADPAPERFARGSQPSDPTGSRRNLFSRRILVGESPGVGEPWSPTLAEHQMRVFWSLR